MDAFFLTSDKTEMSTKTSRKPVEKSTKVGRLGQKPIDVFFSSSAQTEMTQTTGQIDEVLRSFVCIKCGAEHVEVPCHQGIMKCQLCNNIRRNRELENVIYEHASPDYINTFDHDDERFNYKEFLKYNTKRHQERLGTLEGSDPRETDDFDENIMADDDVDIAEMYHLTPEMLEMFQKINFRFVSRIQPCKWEDRSSPIMRNHRIISPKGYLPKSNTTSITQDKIILAKIAEQVLIPDGSEIITNTMKRNVRLVNMLQSDDAPTYKLVQLNSWKKILRENQEALNCLGATFDPEHPPLGPKELGNWTWQFRSMTTLEQKVQAFARIIHKPIDDSMLHEVKIGDMKMIFMEGSPDDVTPAKLERQDWLALRSKIGIEPWHDETRRPKFSYQAYLYKITARLYPQRRRYFNPWTPIFVEIVNNEAQLPTPVHLMTGSKHEKCKCGMQYEAPVMTSNPEMVTPTLRTYLKTQIAN